jgi:hypothetical protein
MTSNITCRIETTQNHKATPNIFQSNKQYINISPLYDVNQHISGLGGNQGVVHWLLHFSRTTAFYRIATRDRAMTRVVDIVMTNGKQVPIATAIFFDELQGLSVHDRAMLWAWSPHQSSAGSPGAASYHRQARIFRLMISAVSSHAAGLDLAVC